MIRAIAAIDDKQGIAAGGSIPWNIPEDHRHFRSFTEHGVVVMGWATYEEFALPLPNRRNIVVSRTQQPVREGWELITDVEAFLQLATEDVWIIGGAQLYASTLQFCDELYLTQVVGDFNCDRFFPPFEADFTLQDQSPMQTSGQYQYQFNVYQRANKNRQV
ncbi:MAG: dihydrofolate reductase [Candidatus Saccharibacteria bacterium]|nr:dihydrofolate reductase [Candidatus Saccharibacteria bacterium]